LNQRKMDQNTSLLEAIILPQARSLRPGKGKVTLSPGNTSQVGHSHDIFIVTLADGSKIIARQICFLDSLAGFLVELWSIPGLGCVGAETPNVPYSKWLQDMLDRAIKRCITGTGKWGTTRDYLVMRSMIGYYAYDYDYIAEYGIAHGDLHANNIMVNDLLQLTGYVSNCIPPHTFIKHRKFITTDTQDSTVVVDWDWAFEAPLPAIVQFPWFIADVPGWHNDGTSPGDSFRENRDYLVQTLRIAEMSKTGSDKLSILLASARERQIFQSAINFRDIHKEFVAGDQRFQVARKEDMRPELEAFLVKHPDLRDACEVKLIMASMQ
ncbi:unnamed protein product, partial [Aureobasidium mustum]